MEAEQPNNTADQNATPEQKQTLWDRKRAERMECLLSNLANGNSRARSCEYAGLSRQAFYDWLRHDADFAWRVEMAELEATSEAESVLFACAMMAEEDPRYQRSLKLYLERQDRRREHLLALQDERRRGDEDRARAEEQRRQEEQARRKAEREARRAAAIRAHVAKARRRQHGRSRQGADQPESQPVSAERKVDRSRNARSQARRKAHRRAHSPGSSSPRC